jgi:hypothetical protein
MNLDDILKYSNLPSFFSFFSILLITCKQSKNREELPKGSNTSGSNNLKENTVDNHHAVKLINMSHYQNIYQGPIWPDKQAS